MKRCLITTLFALTLIGAMLFALLVGIFQALSGTGNTSAGHGNIAVAQNALEMAQFLYNCPPDNFDQCWRLGFPQTAISYWQRTCPNCSAWQNGNLQCVMLITAAYGLANEPLPAVGNAIDFWPLYAHRPGWIEIPSGHGLPATGDMMVMSSPFFGGVGHIAIVLNVMPPLNGHDGSIMIAQANGPGAINTFPLPANLIVSTWTLYTTLGFIRAAPH